MFPSTTTTPDSNLSHSPVFWPTTPLDDLDMAPPLGGQLEDWLSLLIREIDEELKVVSGLHSNIEQINLTGHLAAHLDGVELS